SIYLCFSCHALHYILLLLVFGPFSSFSHATSPSAFSSLSLHDALPICTWYCFVPSSSSLSVVSCAFMTRDPLSSTVGLQGSLSSSARHRSGRQQPARLPRPRHSQLIPRPRRAHVQQRPLLQLGRLSRLLVVRGPRHVDARGVVHAEQHHVRELHALGAVEGHHQRCSAAVAGVAVHGDDAQPAVVEGAHQGVAGL